MSTVTENTEPLAVPEMLGWVLQAVQSAAQGVSSQPDQRTLLIAADCALDHDQFGLESFLRFWANTIQVDRTPWTLATGSRVYGRPKPHSDFDLVWYCEGTDLEALRKFADSDSSNGKVPDVTYFTTVGYDRDEEMTDQTTMKGYGSFGLDAALRFGPINLICVSSWAQSRSWEIGTRNLVERLKMRPDSFLRITRNEAVTEFQHQFRCHRLFRRSGNGVRY